MLRAPRLLPLPCRHTPSNLRHTPSNLRHTPSNQLCIRFLTTSQRRAITRQNGRVSGCHGNQSVKVFWVRTLSSDAPVSKEGAASEKSALSRALGGINVSGYTRVLAIFLGFLVVVVMVAEQSIAKDQIIVDVLPQPPEHDVVQYDSTVFSQISVPTQLFNSQTKLINIHGASGCGLTEFIRQYGVWFKEDGPHLYYKLNRLSNRRSPQVFVLNAKDKVSLGHSLAHLVAKLRQKAESIEGEDRTKSMVTAASVGLKKHSRWLLVFENVGHEVDVMQLLEGYEDWGDGQIIITSSTPRTDCESKPLVSIVPYRTLQSLYFNIAPADEMLDINPDLLYKTFGFDMHSVVAAASIVKQETEQGNQFTFSNLLQLIGEGDAKSKVLKLCTALTALNNPKLLFAFDFIGQMPKGVPIPTAYLKHHMMGTMYDDWYEAVYHYSVHRNRLRPNTEAAPVEPAPEPELLSYWQSKKAAYSVYLGLEPDRGWFQQVYEIVKPPAPPPVVPEDIALLKSCPLLKVDPLYGGHLSTVTVSDEVHEILSDLHTDFTAPLLESAIVLQKDVSYHSTWISKWRGFDQKGKQRQAREDILGKGRVVDGDAETPPPSVLDHVMFYKTPPIPAPVMKEYRTLLAKQVLKTLIAHVDTVPTDTVPGLIESLFLAELIAHQTDKMEPPFSGLARTCSLHLTSQLGVDNVEELMSAEVERARLEDPKGPSLASALHRYGSWLHDQDRNAEAKVLLEEAVTFADSLSLNRTMGLVASELGDLTLAQQYLEKAVEAIKVGDEALLGPLLTDLGQIHLLQGKTGMGIRYLQAAINGYKTQVGTNNPEYVRTLNIVSIGHLMLGDTERSRRARGASATAHAALRKGNLLVGS